jgi:hypothetical protein
VRVRVCPAYEVIRHVDCGPVHARPQRDLNDAVTIDNNSKSGKSATSVAEKSRL